VAVRSDSYSPPRGVELRQLVTATSITGLFDTGAGRSEPVADNLVKHILDMPDGPFEALMETTEEGVDIVPSHHVLGDFTPNLEQQITYETGMQNMSHEGYPGSNSSVSRCGNGRHSTNSMTLWTPSRKLDRPTAPLSSNWVRVGLQSIARVSSADFVAVTAIGARWTHVLF